MIRRMPVLALHTRPQIPLDGSLDHNMKQPRESNGGKYSDDHHLGRSIRSRVAWSPQREAPLSADRLIRDSDVSGGRLGQNGIIQTSALTKFYQNMAIAGVTG